VRMFNPNKRYLVAGGVRIIFKLALYFAIDINLGSRDVVFEKMSYFDKHESKVNEKYLGFFF
jgi:hypothetical protein